MFRCIFSAKIRFLYEKKPTKPPNPAFFSYICVFKTILKMIDPSNFFKLYNLYNKMNNQNNPNDNSERAESTVRAHVLWAMGAGFIPLPVADALAVAAVQLDMIRNISAIYGVAFAETQGKAIISSLAGSALSRLGANALIKAIPVIGTFIGGASMSVMSGASTYAIGQVFKRHFEVGGTFVDFDTSRFKKFYDEQFEKGKQVAEEVKKEKESVAKTEEVVNNATKTEIKVEGAQNNPISAPLNNPVQPTQNNPVSNNQPAQPSANSEIVNKLKELAELKEMGVITEEEFTQMKARLIENYK
jgi:uncharacterized protein (DUF697 family)